MKRIIAIVGIVVLLVLGASALLLRQILSHGFSAREKPWAIEEFLARRARNLATDAEARRLTNPYTANPEIMRDASDHFADHCAFCHGEDGSGKTEIGQGMYPPPPDLREPSTQELTDGELFQIIQNGIRFTGMPGWGGLDTDDEIWQLVLFLRHLPQLSPEELEHLREVHHEKASAADHPHEDHHRH